MINQTSILAYYSMDDRLTRKENVFKAIKNQGPISNLGIAKALKLPINSITGRTRELVLDGRVKKHDTVLLRYSKKTVRVNRWVAT